MTNPLIETQDWTDNTQECLPYLLTVKHTYVHAMDNPLVRPDGSMSEANKIWADADDYRYSVDIDPNARYKPLSNILMTHPHFNTTNERFMQCLRDHYAMETINTAMLDVPVNKITFNAVLPVRESVESVADTCSNIQAINTITSVKYKEFLLKDTRQSYVRTGNGYVTVQDYLPMQIEYKNKLINTKFYVLHALPDNMNFLIGRRLLKALDYTFARVNSIEYLHEPEPEYVDDLGDQSCELYPLSTDAAKLDLDSVKVGDANMRGDLLKILGEYKECMTKEKYGEITGIKPVHITLRDDIPITPVKSPTYTIRHDYYEPMRKTIADLAQQQLLGYSSSDWRSSAFGRAKKLLPGQQVCDVRLVNDFQVVNDFIKSDEFPIPNIHKLLGKFRGKRYISSLDMKAGYWHIPLDEASRRLTAFSFDGKLYEWNVLPMGLKTAPAIFQRIMTKLFAHLDFVTVYLDDIAILSDNYEQHLQHLKTVFDVINRVGIRLRLEKCLFGAAETEYLGYYVNKYGYKPTDQYKEKVLSMPKPDSRDGMQRFLGLIAYLTQFIPDLQDVAKPLYETLKKDVPFTMTPARTAAWEELRIRVNKADYLIHPNPNKPIHVFCDASINGIGGVIGHYKSKLCDRCGDSNHSRRNCDATLTVEGDTVLDDFHYSDTHTIEETEVFEPNRIRIEDV